MKCPIWFTNESEVYDPQSDSWSPLRPVPVAGSVSAVVVGMYIFLFVHGLAIFRFDPICQVYESLGGYPVENWNCFSVTVVGESTIVLCGGMSMGKLCDQTYCLEVGSLGPTCEGGFIDSSELWHQEVSMPQARRRSAVVSVSSRFDDAGMSA